MKSKKKARSERALNLRMTIEPTQYKGVYNVWCEGFGYAGCDVYAKNIRVARRAVVGFLFNELSAEGRLESDEFDEAAEK